VARHDRQLGIAGEVEDRRLRPAPAEREQVADLGLLLAPGVVPGHRRAREAGESRRLVRFADGGAGDAGEAERPDQVHVAHHAGNGLLRASTASSSTGK